MRDVDGLRDSAEQARQAGGDRRMVIITPELADSLADAANAAREVLDKKLPHGGYCARVECVCPANVQRARAALARLDGEDTG